VDLLFGSPICARRYLDDIVFWAQPAGIRNDSRFMALTLVSLKEWLGLVRRTEALRNG